MTNYIAKKGKEFWPSKEMKEIAWVSDEKIYKEANKNPIKFWEKLAKEGIVWEKPWKKAYEEKLPYFKWFKGGKLNFSVNCLDRHLKDKGDKTALIWVPELTNEKTIKITYKELYDKVNRFANVLKKYGVKKGDNVAIYMPMIPEVAVAMLACTRIGATHSVVFSAFSADALKARIEDAKAKILVTADGYYRRGEKEELLEKAKQAANGTTIKRIIVIRRLGEKLDKGLLDFEEEIKKAEDYCKPEIVNSEDMMFILYTSGCCHGNSIIQLANGEINKIKDVVENNTKPEVINFNSNPFTQIKDNITHLHRYPTNSALYKIRTPSFEATFTPNHILFSLDENGNLVEKEAGSLNKGGKVFVVSKISIKGEKQQLPLLKQKGDYRNKTTYKPENIPRIPVFLTPKFAQILGYFIGDGHLDNRSAIFTDKDKDNLIFYKELVEKELGLRGIVKKIERQRLHINSSTFRAYMKEVFPEIALKSRERMVPKIIQKSEKECIAGFLRGLFDAEGTIGHSFVKLSNTSENLIRESQLLLRRFGILAKVYYGLNKERQIKNHKIKETPYLDLIISERESLNIFYEKICFSDKSKKLRLREMMEKVSFRRIFPKERFPIFSLLKELTKTIKVNWRGEFKKMTKYVHSNQIDRKGLILISEFLDKKIKIEVNAEKLEKLKLIREKIQRLMEFDGIVLEKVLEINKVDNEYDFVYDLTAEKNHNYIVNGFLTHNTTGKPKGIVHDTGGYAVQAYWTAKYNFNLHDEDIMWCVPPDTSIITNFGTKKISEIKKDDCVLSSDGKFIKVLETFQRHFDGELIKIKLHYFSEPILITPNHKIKVSKNKKGPFEWIPASEIKKGYYLLFPKIRGTKGYKRKIQISDVVNYKKYKYKIKDGKIFSSKGKHKISNRITINKNLMRLFGYYCAEGSADRDAFYFNFGKHEREYIEDTKDLLFNIFGVDAKIKESNISASPVYISSTILSKLFEKLFGKYAHEKKLPDWFIFLPNKLLAEFIKGFWRGDGNLSNHGFEFVTTSRILSNQLRMILIKSGVIPSVNIRKINGKKERYSKGKKFTYRNNIHRITITGNSIEKLSKILGVKHPFINQRSKTFNRGKITKNFLWVPIMSINKEKYEGKVLNLKTESETYTLNGSAVHNCTADIGWITGHTYAVYGPLLNGCTSLIYEGSPDFPDFGRWWKIIQDNKVSVFYTAPTAIRMFMKAGEHWPKKYDLSSIKILGTVGEPIDDEAWLWYFNKIGGARCPVIDTWWQTETGGTLINSLPGIGPFVPTIAGKSFPGTKHIVVDDKGKEIKKGETGNLVQLSPFAPGMLHGVYKNHKKYVETYWSYWKKFKKKYYDTSDGAYRTKDGLFRLTGRTDDVMKVAGHRLATAELENALNDSEQVNESAVVPIPDQIKGQVPVAFVVLEKNVQPGEELEKELKKHVDKKIGPTARPAKIYFVEDLPKTRSGKIMRRILKNILAKEEPVGLMTLVNPNCVEKIKEIIQKGKE